MTDKPRSRFHVWLVAVRPFAYTASISAVCLGLALAYYCGHAIDWFLFALTLIGVVCFHTAANLLNDCYDHRRGLDTEVHPTSGAVVRGWLAEQDVLRAAVVFLAAGVACGLWIVVRVGWVPLAIGLVGTLLALGYTTSGFCLKYVGAGDLAIFLSFGVLPVLGSYWVQARELSLLPVLWSLPLVSFTVGILHANNWHDIESDSAKNCRTFASRIGRQGSQAYYRTLMLGPFVAVALYFLVGFVPGIPRLAPWTVFLSFAALPAALGLTTLKGNRHPGQLVALDGRTARVQLMFALLVCIAFFGGRHLLQFG